MFLFSKPKNKLNPKKLPSMDKHCHPWVGLGIDVTSCRSCIQPIRDELLPLSRSLLSFHIHGGLLTDQGFNALMHCSTAGSLLMCAWTSSGLTGVLSSYYAPSSWHTYFLLTLAGHLDFSWSSALRPLPYSYQQGVMISLPHLLPSPWVLASIGLKLTKRFGCSALLDCPLPGVQTSSHIPDPAFSPLPAQAVEDTACSCPRSPGLGQK